MYLFVTSGIPFNQGRSVKIESAKDDLACDVIHRICILMQIKIDRKMYLKLEETGVEIGGRDVLGEFVRYFLENKWSHRK